MLFLRNQENHDRYIPANNIEKGQMKFEVIDSLLSELAVLGLSLDTHYQSQKL